MSRAANLIGWGTQDTNTPVTADELNDVYTHGQFWVPAGALTPGDSDPFTLETYEPSGTNYPTFTVGKFPKIETENDEPEGFFTWGFKADFMKTASLDIKIYPAWFVKAAGTPPNDVVRWSAAVYNTLIGTDIDFNAAASESAMEQETKAADILNGGDTSDDENALALTVLNDTLSASNFNLLTFMIERESNEAGDTFPGDVFLLGLSVQFSVNFNNVAVWPT